MTTTKLLLLVYVLGCFILIINSGCEKPPVKTNTPTVADAGPDQTIMKPQDNTTLSGHLSHDLGNIVSFEWSTVVGPNSPNMDKDRILFLGLKPYGMFVSDLVEGVYQFELIVTDHWGTTDRDTMKVTVLPDVITSDPSRIKRYDTLWWGDSCAIRIPNISSAIPAASFQVFMSSYYGGGPMSSFVPSSGWYQVHEVRSSGFWYEIKNDVLIIHAAANLDCDWDDSLYDVLIKWN